MVAEAASNAAQPNPNAMVLATVNEHGQPSARVVLCKGIEPERGYIVFYTNYESQKGRDLQANPRAAVVFTGTTNTARCEPRGVSSDCPTGTTTPISNPGPGKAASERGRAARAAGRVAQRHGRQRRRAARRFGIPYGGPGTAEPDIVAAEVPRPPHWGGFRLNVEAVELWVRASFAIHDRARWTRIAGDAGSVKWTSGGYSRRAHGSVTRTTGDLPPLLGDHRAHARYVGGGTVLHRGCPYAANHGRLIRRRRR